MSFPFNCSTESASLQEVSSIYLCKCTVCHLIISPNHLLSCPPILIFSLLITSPPLLSCPLSSLNPLLIGPLLPSLPQLVLLALLSSSLSAPRSSVLQGRLDYPSGRSLRSVLRGSQDPLAFILTILLWLRLTESNSHT